MLMNTLFNFLGYSYIIIGSMGMILFTQKFPFSSRIQELEYTPEKLIGLNGYEVWAISWVLMIPGGISQLMCLLN